MVWVLHYHLYNQELFLGTQNWRGKNVFPILNTLLKDINAIPRRDVLVTLQKKKPNKIKNNWNPNTNYQCLRQRKMFCFSSLVFEVAKREIKPQLTSVTTEFICPQILFPNVITLFKVTRSGTTHACVHLMYSVTHLRAPKFHSEWGSQTRICANLLLIPPNSRGAPLKFMELHRGVHVCLGKSLARLEL